MHKIKKICLTGGGTAGHVMPHLALLDDLRARGWDLFYVGSYRGIERDLIAASDVRYYPIATGKLRRYLSFENLVDIGRVVIGVVQAWTVLLRERPAVVFSKGGFVSVPVAVAAWLWRIPVVSHESDLTPGLANKIIGRFASKILYTFAETKQYLPNSAEFVGLPVRTALLRGDPAEGMRICGFAASDARPLVLVMGGSMGAQRLNEALYEALPDLLRKYRVVHLTGKGKGKAKVVDADGYKFFEFLGAELPHVLAASAYVVSRAGATAIFEFLALRKPMLLVPLVAGSRGDQLLNAAYFVKQGWAQQLDESGLKGERLLRAIDHLAAHASAMHSAQASYPADSARQKVVATLGKFVD